MKISASRLSFLRIALFAGLVTAACVSQAIAGPGVDYWLNQGKSKNSTTATTACVKAGKDNKQQAATASDPQVESAQASPTTSSSKAGSPAGLVKQR